MKLDQHDIAVVTHAIIERVEKDIGPMNPMTMIGIREVIENHEFTLNLPLTKPANYTSPEYMGGLWDGETHRGNV